MLYQPHPNQMDTESCAGSTKSTVMVAYRQFLYKTLNMQTIKEFLRGGHSCLQCKKKITKRYVRVAGCRCVLFV